MVLEPVVIEGVTRPVTVTRNRFGGDVQLLVDGRPVPQGGVSAREYQLPLTTGGTATATVRTGLADPYPTIEFNGSRYRTGPRPPIALRILALVPLLAALAGLFGAVLAVPALLANLALLTTQISPTARTLAVVGVDVTAIILIIILYRATT